MIHDRFHIRRRGQLIIQQIGSSEKISISTAGKDTLHTGTFCSRIDIPDRTSEGKHIFHFVSNIQITASLLSRFNVNLHRSERILIQPDNVFPGIFIIKVISFLNIKPFFESLIIEETRSLNLHALYLPLQ